MNLYEAIEDLSIIIEHRSEFESLKDDAVYNYLLSKMNKRVDVLKSELFLEIDDKTTLILISMRTLMDEYKNYIKITSDNVLLQILDCNRYYHISGEHIRSAERELSIRSVSRKCYISPELFNCRYDDYLVDVVKWSLITNSEEMYKRGLILINESGEYNDDIVSVVCSYPSDELIDWFFEYDKKHGYYINDSMESIFDNIDKNECTNTMKLLKLLTKYISPMDMAVLLIETNDNNDNDDNVDVLTLVLKLEHTFDFELLLKLSKDNKTIECVINDILTQV